MTPSLTRSAASASRWRSATLATATVPEASSASRNSMAPAHMLHMVFTYPSSRA